MRTAAVGFHCPDCVSEGAKSVRTARTAYGGTRSANPALTSQVLIALNVAVYLVVAATGGASAWFYRLALIPQGANARIDGVDSFVPGVTDGSYWQLATSAFTHLSLFHIGFNMLALWVLGPQLEMVLGRVRFLAVYLVSALSGSVFVYWLTATNVPTIGASGAIYGLLGALLVVAYKVRANVNQLLFWIGLNFLITFTAPFISWQGHLGGFVGGVVLASVIVYAPKQGRARWQLAGIAAYTLLLLAAIVGRTAVLL
jgi:membrane associated rhomboid family serine protease